MRAIPAAQFIYRINDNQGSYVDPLCNACAWKTREAGYSALRIEYLYAPVACAMCEAEHMLDLDEQALDAFARLHGA